MRALLLALLLLLPALAGAKPLGFSIGTSKPVVVDTSAGVPRVWLDFGGGESRAATYRAGSGTQVLEFAYDVVAGDFAPAGIVAAGEIDLAGGSIRDAAGNPLTLTFTPPDLSGVKVQTYRAAWTTDPITSVNAASAAFQITKPPPGATFAWQITSDGGGSASGSGTIATSPHPVTSLDLSALADGTLTLTVTLTTAAGTGAARTATVAKSPAWSPALLPALALWLDGADLDGDGVAEGMAEGGQSGGAVAAWADKSGAGRSVGQGTAANRPTLILDGIGGAPALAFDGGRFLTGSPGIFVTSDLITVGIVATFADTTSRLQLFDFGVGANHSTFMIQQNTHNTVGQRYGLDSWAPGGGTADSSIPTSAGPKLFTLVANTATGNPMVSSTTYVVDGAVATLQIRAQNGIYSSFGAAPSFWISTHHPERLNGRIAEVVVANTLADAGDRQRLEGYLAWKWGLQGNLPADHPWKAAPP
ncbi:MAG: hypothetical protein FJ382_15075 [Verrucomicrobia bacterium]|nr:hypothetical protein [Verrucomicrobiota bacterium]